MFKRVFKNKLVIGIIAAMVMVSGVGIKYAAGVDGPQDRELSLEEAIELAVKNNPDVEIQNLAVEKAKIEYDGAKYTAKNIDEENVHTYELGLVKWLNPKAKEVALALAEKGKEVSDKSMKLGVEKAYYDVIKAEKNLVVERDGLKYMQNQLKIAQTAYKVGTKAKVDVTTVEAGVAAYQTGVTSAENDYRIAVMELNRIMGIDLDTPLNLTSKFSVEKTGDSINLEETINQALEDNIEILSSRKTLEINKVQYDLAKKFYGRGVTIFETAELDTKSAEASVRKQELSTKATIRQGYLTLFSLEKMLDWQQKEVEKAKENARIFLLKYEAGLATSLDVKKATIDLEEAELNLSENIYKYNLLKSQFKYQLFSLVLRQVRL